MGILGIVTLVNQLASGALRLGITFSQIADLQRRAEAEGRELTVQDFERLRAQTAASLQALDRAIEAAERGEDVGPN